MRYLMPQMNRNPLLETIIADFESTALALTEGKP